MFDVTCDVTSEIMVKHDLHQRVVDQGNGVLCAPLAAAAASAVTAFALFVPVSGVEPMAVHAPAAQHRDDCRGRPLSPTVQGCFLSALPSQCGLREVGRGHDVSSDVVCG